VSAFGSYGETLHLTRQRLDDELEKGAAQSEFDDPENGQVVAWLSEQEMRYRFVIYESDATPAATPWARRCIRQADQILFVGWANSNPELSEIELLMEKERQMQSIASARQSLVLLHPDGASPVGTSKWLKRRQGRRHHHLRWKRERGTRAGVERLARVYTGRAVGLVFGGGGARGMAHIGVLRAIEELGLEVDMVGGTSSGALIAALYAIGLDHEAMHNAAKEFINPKQMFDYTLPMISFLGGRHFTNIIRKLFGEIQIEDTWLEFFCVSSNLTRATEMIHRRGPLWKYLRATASLPMFFPPVVDHGDLLIDGGLVNFLPLDVMSRLCAGGPVIALDVAQEADLTADYQFGPSLSGWRVLWSRINPFQAEIKIPKPFDVFMRVIEFNRIRRNSIERRYADLYIRPPVEQFDMLEFTAYEEMIEIGYRSALPQLKAWMTEQGLNG
jgi:NTE family protein/lysophospholipid hydrolase